MRLSAVRAADRRDRVPSRGFLAAATCLSTLLCAPGYGLAQETATELSPIVVEGQTDSPVGPDDGYIAKNTTTGSKTDTPLKEIPQSVSVVTRKQLDDRQPAQLEDTLSYLAGVTASPWGVDNRFDQCLIRGFDLCTYVIYRDGLPQKAIDFSGFKIEPYGLERVEVLKGPSSVLYGENEAGGMINAISKRPTETPIYDGYLSYGSFNTVEAGLDIGGPIDDAGVWTYRLTGLVRNGEIETDYSRNDRIFVAPALKWQPDAQTSLTILANYQWDRLAPNAFLPVAGEQYPAEYGKLPRNFFTGSPGFDRYDANHGSIGYQFSHEFDDNWTVRQNLRYSRQDTDYRQLYYSGMIDDRTMARTAFTVDETATIFSVDNQAEYDRTFGAVQNKLLVGLDYNRFSVDGQNHYGAGPDLDILNPDYSQPITIPDIWVDRTQTIGQIGLYAQNQSKIADHWLLTLGGRQSWIDNTNSDRLDSAGSYRQKDHAFTGNVGIGYLFDNGLTPYVSYAESFTTNIGQTQSGAAFQPSSGKQYEVGVKYEPTFFPGFITASLFDLRKTNIVTYAGGPFQIQTGEVRHRGLEIEANADLASGLSMTAAYTYLDAEITRDDPLVIGNRPSLVPEHQASLWANYEVGHGMLEGLSAGAGVRYIGASFGDNANTVNVPSYTLVDAALRYKKNGWQAALNVSNLFDKTYYSTCYPGSGCIYGEGRVIKGSLSMKF
ncbi:TonB-dependent siderophore receptor [Mesorhizobium sp. YC-39]|uniref:TonB-dependent siderophore receptor n=1 Tax=unclassified Mesorhizobium TaxID=325217 RepID=UPI0021E92942|nr:MULTISPECIES: TonB-dependent siderophore receptor [unclassified Mesorhizobium]MCV3205714.1 TonB-dependent siderophore receptor [Mesorhizobium sp. YC-2]MCV3227887.1 TonB-dependent siderophore receptor [Mesorhizobium sp. YC-39]